MKKMFIAIFYSIIAIPVLSQEQNDSINSAEEQINNPNLSSKASNDSLQWEHMLEGVTISAQRQLIKSDIDRVSYDIQADEESKTENAFDILRKVPMVSVDAQDNILVKGNSNFKIYKNGHLDPSLSKNAKDILRAMPASMLKRIEVITDPGAREDAEGVDAILNFVMVENKSVEGITGTLTGSYTNKNHPNAYVHLTTQLGKVIASVNYGYGGMSEKETENIHITDRKFSDTGNTMHINGHSNNPGQIHYSDIDLSYEIDSLNLLSGSFGGYFYDIDVKGSNDTSLHDSTNSLVYGYQDTYNMPIYSHQSWDGRMDFEHKTLRKGEKLTLSYMLGLTRQHSVQQSIFSNSINIPFSYDIISYNTRERFTEHTFQLDWLRPLCEGHKLELGMKYINRQNNSHSIQSMDFETETDNDRYLDHTTRVGAGYIDYQYSKGKWSGRAGLRFEHSSMKAHYPDGKSSDFSKHLNDWVPQATLKYQISDAQSLKLSYTTSINRPGIEYLNPVIISYPTRVRQGNPHLSSSTSQRITMMYMHVGNKLTLQLAPSYTFFNDNIGIVESSHDDILYEGYDNILRLRRLQFEGYVQWKPFSTSTLVMNWNMNNTISSNPNLGISQKGFSTFYYCSLTQKLPWKLTGSASIYGSFGHSPKNVYSYERSWYSWAINLQRSFLTDNRLTVRIGARNPFRSHVIYKHVTDQGNYFQNEVQKLTGETFYMSLSFRFGKLKANVKKTDITIENDDIVGGITKSSK